MEYDYKRLSDKELVLKAKEGDQLAFRIIYERHSAAVRSRISSYFNWSADIDDVVSVTFQKFFSKLDSFDTERDLMPWLITIATRTALDHLQSIKREEEKKEGIKHKSSESSEDGLEILTEVNPEDEIINGEEHERLMGFIEELPSKYKEVMKKYMIEELEYERIAQELELELNTVRTRIRRGKEKLAEMMLRGEVE
ncbi:MAG: RNA polymerase sigma factor [Bacteroidales bacterium]|jgi:RNA polymerase sigma-70 factor (ECF subfamily)|nr:RNA polymerase sigma factor [Bacteroidales bacterium]